MKKAFVVLISRHSFFRLLLCEPGFPQENSDPVIFTSLNTGNNDRRDVKFNQLNPALESTSPLESNRQRSTITGGIRACYRALTGESIVTIGALNCYFGAMAGIE